MIRDYFQDALQTFNGGDWYGWKKEDSEGNKIPNDQRMTYANIEIIKEVQQCLPKLKSMQRLKN